MCVINVSDDDLEATTLVISSDLDLIVKSSRREVLVFVQDMLAARPASGVELLFSDGKKVFATGKTGDDGVFRGRFDELKDMGRVGVFALSGGHVASNALNLSGLGFSQGLSARGYLYTDRPVYQPGQTVKLRGIIRDVVDGSYAAPRDETYLVSITDSSGRMLWEEPQELSEFGTFHAEMTLDDRAPLGGYTITARHKEKPKLAYSGTFRVQRFKLEKMRLALETDRRVYFRGEEVELTIKAQYYWGQPVAGKPIRYDLPDGRHFVQSTDEDGKLVVKYDTTGLRPGAAMGFRASIEGENVGASHVALLALEGFGIGVRPARDLVLSGEPFDVEVKTTTPDGKPVGRAVTLFVLRRHRPKADPVLGGVPWIKAPSKPSAEVTIDERKVVTDEKTGAATVNLKLEKGGRYILRATGEDRFKQVITAEGHVNISDDEDATKLRFFAETDTLQVGRKARVRLHSRLDAKLALLTHEGEEIISHEVISLHKGYNGIDLAVGHEHFPNFRVALAVMDGRALRTAEKPFKVERQLNVAVKPLEDVYLPGVAGRVELTVTDQLGKPVRAELSLALIDEALFAIYADGTPPILDFFQKDARRHAEFRAASTCSFAYAATTRAVVKAYLEERERLALKEAEDRELEKLARTRRALFAAGDVLELAPVSATEGGPHYDEDGDAPESRPAGARSARRRGGKEGAVRLFRDDSLGVDDLSFESTHGDFGRELAAPEQPREELPEAGRWIGSIVTDERGKAIVELPMPENTTEWRLTSRGCTVETLVGEATGNVITRKDFFVEMKVPQQLQEGDTVRVLARVHNMTDYAGPVDLTLTVLGGSDLAATLIERTLKVDVTKQGGAEALFEGVEIPLAAALRIQVAVRAGKHTDALVATVPVRPWGLEFADHAGGAADGDATTFVALPKDRKYSSTWMTVSVGPDLKRSVIQMVLGDRIRPTPAGARCILIPPPGRGSFAGSDLLAAVSALEYARKVNAQAPDVRRLSDRARSLVSALVTSQRDDGGWTWNRVKSDSDWAVTAMSFWALCEAREHGIVVHADTLGKARKYLKDKFTRVSANDNDAKAVILHALSAGDAAEFAHANRLHRVRNSLSAPALAYTALTFVNLKRNEFAGELLDVLETRGKTAGRGGKKLMRWEGSSKHAWLSDDLETTAVAALALMRARPASPRIKQAVDYLMSRRGTYGFVPAKAQGPAVSAVAAYFAAGKFAEADYRLSVRVNGKELQTIESKGAPVSVDLPVPADLIAKGENKVAFRMDGRGEYAYSVTLRGFSSDLKDPRSWDYPYVQTRYYRHATLEYRGRPIGASSSSPVKNVEIGQRVAVRVGINNYQQSSRNAYMTIEEHLPAGMMYVEGSLKSSAIHHEVHAGKLVMYYPPNRRVSDFNYELVGYSTGACRVLPTVMRDALHPGRMRVGAKADLAVLTPGEVSDDPYKMNNGERHALGRLHFEDGLYEEALGYLSHLFKHNRTYQEREVARMLLWIYTSEGFYDAQQIVDVFEVLRERYPQLELPFDKTLVAGRAYRDLGEFERAYLIFRATIDASFINDSNVSAVLEDEGQFLGSIDYREDLWREYPDTAQVTAAYFALSQALYQNAPRAREPAKEARQVALARGDDPDEAVRMPSRIEMLKETIRLLSEFLTLYPDSPLADDAAFSMANAFLDLKQFDAVVKLCAGYKRHFADSEFASGFQYMIALGQFWQHQHRAALTAAKVVAEGKSKDRDFARYIVGQIYHAEGNPAEAIVWYRKVAGQYADAKQAIDYFERKHIALEEVSVFRPGKPVELTLKYRNVKEAFFQVYSVDLMKLYLREKNLSNITKVNLAGIEPLVERTIQFGDGKDYIDKEETTGLALEEEGAYLVICRGDDLFASGMVLITPLKIEVQEDATSGRVRAHVIDAVEKKYVPEVHVKAIGSADREFRSGETDLRGIYVADNVRGKATVIARAGDARYAFYRGETWLGAPQDQRRQPRRGARKGGALDYQTNLRLQNDEVQIGNVIQFDQMRRQRSKGVQLQQAQ
ncbi:MAG: MG2 domain-containing protein [Candidatus Brocadiia bacterium]|nr:MG2 domain-containing protein [Candidatus Brocadiia bacterium]